MQKPTIISLINKHITELQEHKTSIVIPNEADLKDFMLLYHNQYDTSVNMMLSLRAYVEKHNFDKTKPTNSRSVKTCVFNSLWVKRKACEMNTGEYCYILCNKDFVKCRVGKKNCQHVYYYLLNEYSNIVFDEEDIVLRRTKPSTEVYMSDEDVNVEFDSNFFD